MRHASHSGAHYTSQPRDDGASVADDRYYSAVLGRQAFHHSRTSLGATGMAGHWIHLLSVAVPLVIPEITKDPDKRWRALRLTSVGAALASEMAWTYQLAQERKREKECREAAAERCAER